MQRKLTMKILVGRNVHVAFSNFYLHVTSMKAHLIISINISDQIDLKRGVQEVCTPTVIVLTRHVVFLSRWQISRLCQQRVPRDGLYRDVPTHVCQVALGDYSTAMIQHSLMYPCSDGPL